MSQENLKYKSIANLYENRFKLLRKGREYKQKSNDLTKAPTIEYYRRYLEILAVHFNTEEANLHPKLFDPKEDLGELLLIGHVYWDMAKFYDRCRNSQKELTRCLDQFTKFTTGFKYQYVNARMLKRFIRKNRARHPRIFKKAYAKIQMDSKSCFIAGEIYGSGHAKTEKLRRFKRQIQRYPLGARFCEIYYQNICPCYFSFQSPKGNILKNPAKKILDLIAFFI